MRSWQIKFGSPSLDPVFHTGELCKGDLHTTPAEPARSTGSGLRFTRHHRACSSRETYERVKPALERLGITRVARLTSLDHIGIPVYSAFRPNARTLSTSQGKGLTDDDARASAVMEAIEQTVAEAPFSAAILGRARDFVADKVHILDVSKQMPGSFELDDTAQLNWLEGEDCITSVRVIVPRDAVVFSGKAPDLPGICQHTNGLASGNTLLEAQFHGLCELIERDASTYWSLLNSHQQVAKCFDPRSLLDPVIDALIDLVEQAGLILRLFDQTTHIGVPTVLACLGPKPEGLRRVFEYASGTGTHLDAATAVIRAITEAAQSRVTTISSSRDDIDPSIYREFVDNQFDGLMAATPMISAMPGRWVSPSLNSDMERLLGCLKLGGVGPVVCVPLGGEHMGFSVCKMIAPGLEDRGVNLHWENRSRSRNLHGELH